MAPLYGANLTALSPANLAALASVHEDGLRRIKALQVTCRCTDSNCADAGVLICDA